MNEMTLMGVDPRNRRSGSGGPASEVPRLVQEGAARRKARDFPAAVDRYLRVLEADPGHLAALRGLAESYRGTGEAERCLEAWDRYLSVRPGEGEVQTRVGDACRKAGRTARAAAHYEAALRHDSGDRYALMGLGDLHQKERRPEAALACWERLLELGPDLLNIRTMAGNLCRRKLDFSRAEQHFRAALRLAPHNAPATFGLADALRGQGRFEEAYPFWIEMLAIDPGNRQVLCRAGDCFARLGRLEEASGLFLRALEGGYDRSALLGLARVHILRQAPEEAVRCYEAILGRNPGDGRAGALRAQLF
jgi:tetratricopeptide (TPR) repeat protein